MNASFFEKEVRYGYCINEQMKKVWACELDLLEKLLDVCNKHGLKCWADAGTLIGAVRDRGFIPWDDDIDMVMMRDDYDKLLQIASQEFHQPYFFQTIYSDKHYNHRHAQLRNSNTTAIPSDGTRRKYNQGIFIDIFVLDTYPKDGKSAYKKIKKLRRLKTFLKLTLKATNYFPDFLYKKCRWDILVFKKYENILRNIPLQDTEYVSCMSLNLKERIRLKSDYQQTEYFNFENIKIPIPQGYDRILRLDYGDYMTPVMAPTLHGKMIYNTELSYKNFYK
jgi:LPS biosynthesis protein